MATQDTDAIAPPAAGWRFKAGIAMFILAFALWLVIPLAASGGAPPARIATLTGIVFLANKALLLGCIAVMGKAGFQQLKGMIFGYAKGFAVSDTVGPIRHAIGLAMFCVPLLTAALEPYFDHFLPGFRPHIWQLQALGDLIWIASFFVLGAGFWGKVRALFIRTAKVVDMGPTSTPA